MPFLPDLDMEYDPDGNKEQVAVVMKGQTYRDAGLKQSQFPNIEGPLYDKLCQFPRHKVRDDVRKLAQNIAIGANEKNFQPSVAWLDNFMRRFCISRKKMGIYSSKMLKVKGAKGKKLGDSASILNSVEIQDSLVPPSDNIDFFSGLGIPKSVNESSSKDLEVVHQKESLPSSSTATCKSTSNNHDKTNGNSLTVPPLEFSVDSDGTESLKTVIFSSYLDSESGIDKEEKVSEGQINGIKLEADESSDAESIKEIPRELSPEKEVINLESESEEEISKFKKENQEEKLESDKKTSEDTEVNQKENTQEEINKNAEKQVTFCEDISNEEEVRHNENDDNEDDESGKVEELAKDDEEGDKETEEKGTKSDSTDSDSDSKNSDHDSDLVVKSISWDEKNFVKYEKADNKFYRLNGTNLKRKLEEKLQNCTACFDSVNHNIKEEVFTHPVLGVLMCKKCIKFYDKGDFYKDSEGYDEYCRWCANGGDLLLCDHCKNGFCRKCVKRNVGRTAEKEAMNSKSWKCYVCDLQPLTEVRAVHRAVLDNIKSISILNKSFTRKERRDYRIKERFSALKLKRKGLCLEKEDRSEKGTEINDQVMKDVKDLCVYCVEQLEEIYKRKSKGSGDDVEIKAKRRLVKLVDIMEKNFAQVKSSVKESVGSGKEDCSVSVKDSTLGNDKSEGKSDDFSKSIQKSPEHASTSSSTHPEKRKRQEDSGLDNEVSAKRVVLETDSEGKEVDDGETPLQRESSKEEGLGACKKKNSSERRPCDKDSSNEASNDEEGSIDDRASSKNPCGESDNEMELGSESEYEKGKNDKKSKNDVINDDAASPSVDDQPAPENGSDSDTDKEPSQSSLKNVDPVDDEKEDAEVAKEVKKGLLLSKSCKFRKKENKALDDEGDKKSSDKEKKKNKKDQIDMASLLASDSDSATDDKKVKMKDSDSETDKKKKIKASDSEAENKKEEKNKISDKAKDKKDEKSKNSDSETDDKKDKEIKGSDCEDKQKSDKITRKKRLELEKIDICDDSSEEESKREKPKPKSKKKNSKLNRGMKSLLQSDSDVSSDDLLGDLENLEKLMKKRKTVKTGNKILKKENKNYKPKPKSVQKALKKKQLNSSVVKLKKLDEKVLNDLEENEYINIDDYPEFYPDDVDLMLDSDTDKELEALLKMKAIKQRGQRDSSDNDADSESDASEDKDSKKKKGKKNNKDSEKGTKKRKKKEGLLDINIDKEDDDDEEEEDEEEGGKKKRGVDRDGMKALLESSEDEQEEEDDDDEDLNDDTLEKANEEEIAKKKKELYEKNKKKLKEKAKAESESDDEEIQKKVRKKGFLSFKFSSSEDDAKDDDDDDSENESPRKSRMFIDSDSDFEMGKKKKKKEDNLFSSSEEDDDDDDEGSSSSSGNDKKKKSKSRKRIKRPSSSTEEEADADGNDNDAETPKKRRRHIIRDEDLLQSTKDATLEEKERRDRVRERQLKYNKIFEIDVESDQKDQKKLVLDFDEESKKELVVVHEKLVSHFKPHQIDGIRFMWDATIENVERLEKKEKGGGCILAHCMGLGKTLQVIAYIHTLITCKKIGQKISRIMVCCPVNTVYNWVAEFKFWLRGKLDVFDVVELISAKDLWARAYKLDDWYNEGGVCIIGYDMFRNLSNANNKRYKGSMKEKFQKCLVDPGPDMMVCDEGHILKNEKTALSIAINKIKTFRRIVLTGTPLQNNLKEYHCMIQFVKPNLLGSKKEFMNRFVHPIEAGQCVDALPRDVRRMKRRAHILHNLLEGCVQRFDYSVLKPFLPPKYEYVVSVQMCDVQCKLYEYYLQNLAQGGPKRTGSGLFVDFQNLSRIWSHPVVLFLALRRRELKGECEGEDEEEEMEGFIDDSDHSISSSDDDKPKKKKKKKNEESDISEEEVKEESKKDVVEPEVVVENTPGLTSAGKVRPDWWRTVLEEISGENYDEDDFLNRVEISGKLYLLFDILRESCSIGDKVLLFSQSILALDMIEEFLRMWDMGEIRFPPSGLDDFGKSIPQPYTRWKSEKDYYRLDGSTSADIRKNQCKNFNNSSNERCRLFLISTKAGGVGINLVAANRVIIFDASWNPSHDTQSIFRVYRFGQKKPCYIYRFVAQGTMEEKIYSRQVTKISTSLRVVDEHQIKRYFNMAELAELYQFTPSKPDDRETPAVPEDRLLAELLIRNKNWIVGYHEQDSLLENQTGEELTEEERTAAWEDYENEKKGVVPQRGYTPGLTMPSNVAKFDIESIYQSIVKTNPGASTVQIYDSVYLATQQIQKVHLSQYQSIQSLMYNLKNPMIAPEILRNMPIQDPNTLLQHLDMQLKNLEENIRAESKVIKQIASITHTSIPHNSMVSAGLARGNPVPGTVSSTAQYVNRNFTTSSNRMFAMPKTSDASTSAAHSSASTSGAQSDPLNISSDKESTDPAEVVTLE